MRIFSKKGEKTSISRRLCWLPAFLLSLATLLAAYFFLDMRYAVNDDADILRALMGYEGGVIANFLPHQHDLLTLPLSLLGSWLPQIPWFS